MKNIIAFIVSAILTATAVSGCTIKNTYTETILVAAAASLEKTFSDKLIPIFTEKYPNIKVEGTYDSSGKLKTQIEEGLAADVFMSAATKQMDELIQSGMIDKDSVIGLLENRIVLIVPKGSNIGIASFNEITKAESIAVGNPESVPAGQYAKEALTAIGVWDNVESKASFGANVTEVLAWVGEGSADAGIVYATDAASSNKVTVVAEAPEGSIASKIIYPAGIVSSSLNKDAAQKFMEFLESQEALMIFEEYGFTALR